MTRRTTIFSRLALLLIAPIVSAQWAYPNENQCTSPNGLPGTCINIKSCPSMVRLLQQQPIPPTTLQFLQRSQCGYEGNDPKVCCESNNGGQGTNTPTQGPPTTGTQSPPDVTNHPNLRLLPSNCGPILRDKIIGGQEAALYQFPWMALLAYNVGKPTPEFRCGGSVISSRYILTAAHCVTNLPSNLKLVGVRVGEHDITTDRDCVTKKDGTTECATDLHQDFGIEEVKFHSEYSRTSLHNDVAVIRVNRDINFRPSNAKAICLPIGAAANYPGKKLTVAGWGVTEQRISSPVLMQVTLTRFSQEECTRVYQRQTEIWYKQMCMGGEQGKDSCNGDSGGPLAAPTVYNGLNKYVQFGIVSFGVRNCGTEGFPGVYTRVDYYLDWILNSMRA